jgi:pyruvate/2-oxoglutarate dehydrogenase complex dihydrolipoamide dehydrogenase (E3) component
LHDVQQERLDPLRYDLIIVGMGSGGMVASEFASTLDLRVAVVERDRVGGDCLWTGCVPSKALIASARAAHTMRRADEYGIEPVEPTIDTAKVFERIRGVQRQIAQAEDNADRFRAMGLDVIVGHPAHVIDRHRVSVDGNELEGRFILLCTGSRPVVPPIEGIEAAGYLTSETVWDLERAPESMVFIGAGPISMELAQAFCRLGVEVTVLQSGDRVLPRDEPELVSLLQDSVVSEGVDLRLNVDVTRVRIEDSGKVVYGTEDGRERRWEAAEILIGAGRRPNVEGLGLEELGIELNRRGVLVDKRSRTKVDSIYAVGDLAGRYLFTHMAGYEGVRAVRDMFFPGRGKVTDFVPWCTFTDPELAHAGQTIGEAEQQFGADDVQIWRQDLVHSDRARADGATKGAIVIVTHKGRVIGAHILAPHAGEMIHELALAIRDGMKLADVAGLIHVYPTYGTTIGQLAADSAFESAQKYKWLVRRQKA